MVGCYISQQGCQWLRIPYKRWSNFQAEQAGVELNANFLSASLPSFLSVHSCFDLFRSCGRVSEGPGKGWLLRLLLCTGMALLSFGSRQRSRLHPPSKKGVTVYQDSPFALEGGLIFSDLSSVLTLCCFQRQSWYKIIRNEWLDPWRLSHCGYITWHLAFSWSLRCYHAKVMHVKIFASK